ncbi:MAG TPA: carboxypeptidase-like regulatory domain-containing protein [Bacteroidales bacterium]|nr:carboxypeptidase-like regulatory domain-containing protein [Bacteroidales bacterium]
MRKFILNIAGLFFMLSIQVNAQQKINVSGFVKDRDNGERLIGANISETGTANGTPADYNGYFNLVVKNNTSLRVSFIGYEDQVLDMNTVNDTIIEVFLIRDVEQLSGVTISAERKRNANISTLDYAQMTQTPSLGGKPDVIKALQLLPGISSQKEGTSLMIVRGGDPGQNLYLFDKVPVIYVNHLGGFMSVFNPDIINNIDVYKGGFPSMYGGRLSSVIDITQREGDYSRYKGSFGAGITDLSFSLEGPAGIRNSSFIVGARKTLFDPLMILLQLSPMAAGDYLLAYGFHDFNGKFSWKPDQKKSLSLNFYQGDDYLNYWSLKREKYRMGDVWGNWLISAKYNTILSSRLFSSSNLSFTRYRLREFMKYNIPGQDTAITFKESYKSSVMDLSFRSGMKFTASENWLAEFGIQSSFLSMLPNETYISTQAVQQQAKPVNSFESAIYADNKFIIKNKWSVTPGFRIVNHLTSGFSDLLFEPRLNADLQFSKNHSINLSYMKVSQYSHLVFTTGSIMNNEVWIPAGKKIPPAKSDQVTAGWNGSFLNGKFTSELSLYYKDMYNLSTYKDGYTSLTGDENWITKVETGGKGRSAGVEFLVRKNSGKWTGFISYVHSKTTRQFADINNGKEYLFDYNRPDNLSVNLNRRINNNLNLNLVWVFQSGLPFTEAIGRQYMPSVIDDWQGNDFFYEGLIYGERNGARMKDYHRLDVALTWSRYNRRNNKVDWSFSIYNVYNRHNPVFYYYNSDKSMNFSNPQWNHDFRPLSLYQLSLFPVMPSISCKVYFDPEARKARLEAQNAIALQKLNESMRSPATTDGSNIKDRWSIKAGYSFPAGKSAKYDPYKVKKYNLELNYGFLDNVEAGIYGGYSQVHLFEQISPYGTRGYRRDGIFYGVNCNYHLLPYVMKRDDLRFDLYATGKLGGVSIKSTKSYEEHCIGGGAAIYLFEHVGIFGEYTYGKFYNTPPRHIFDRPVHNKVIFGLAVKFK